MRYARYADGQPVEIIEPFYTTEDQFGEDGETITVPKGTLVPIEDRFTSEVVATLQPWGDGDLPEPPAPAPVVPRVVTMRQARLALLEAGKYTDAMAAISGMQGVDGDRARIEWEFAATVDRDSPVVQALAQSLALDLDALFATAAAL